MPKKLKPDAFGRLGAKVMELEKILEEKEKEITALRRENYRLQDALPPPDLGLYLFLEIDGSLACSVQTETSTRYALKIREDLSGLAALLSILRARQGKLTRAFASDACPSQTRVNEMIDEWKKTNKITSGNSLKLKDFTP